MKLYYKLPCYLFCLLKSIKHVSEVPKNNDLFKFVAPTPET